MPNPPSSSGGVDPRRNSRQLLEGPDRVVARSIFKAIGFTDEDLRGRSSASPTAGSSMTPCNWNHRELAQKVAEGVRAAGGTPIEFNTVAINDGITMGTEGMKASLVSRELIADSVELVARGHLLDGLVTHLRLRQDHPGHGDGDGARSNLPSVDALRRLDRMSGEYRTGMFATASRSRTSSRRSAPINAGRIDDEELQGHRGPRLPGRRRLRRPVHGQHDGDRLRDAGHLADGLQRRPAPTRGRKRSRSSAGRLAMDAASSAASRRARSSRRSRFENAIAGVMATGGSTNAVLHLLAIGTRIRRRARRSTSSTASRGKRRCWPICSRGATTPRRRCTRPAAWPSSRKRLLAAGLLHADEQTVTGRTIGEEARAARGDARPEGHPAARRPLKPEGGLAILRGNLAPDGCVAKVSGQNETCTAARRACSIARRTPSRR